MCNQVIQNQMKAGEETSSSIENENKRLKSRKQKASSYKLN